MTSPAPLPPLGDVVRRYLAAQASFLALLPLDRLLFRGPADVTTTYAKIQVPNPAPISGDGVAWKPLVQVDAFCPETVTDADVQVWNIVAMAGLLLGRARNIIDGTLSWSGRHTDGPIADVDTSRGESTPLARALIRAELTVHAR